MSASKTRVFNMGACLLNGPLSTAIRAGELGKPTVSRGGSNPGTYSFGEMFQLLDFLEGKVEIPSVYRKICGYRETYEPGEGAQDFRGADVVIIEPNGIVDIDWKGLKLNRAQVQSIVLNPIKAFRADIAKVCNHWYNKAILGLNNDIRDELGQTIAKQLPGDFDNRDLIVSVLTSASGTKRDAEVDIAGLIKRLPIPVGVLAYAYQYMPDGRPMFWPSNLQEMIKKAAAEHGLPYLEPWRLVLEQGGQPVLKPDLRHYHEDFIPTVATYISSFANEILLRNGSNKPLHRKQTSLLKHNQDIHYHRIVNEQSVNSDDVMVRTCDSDDVALRKFPFPFKAGMAIASVPLRVSSNEFYALQSPFVERGIELGVTADLNLANSCNVSSELIQRFFRAGLMDSVYGRPTEESVDALVKSSLKPVVFLGGAPVERALTLAEVGVRYFTDDTFTHKTKFGYDWQFRTAFAVNHAFNSFDYDQFSKSTDPEASCLDEYVKARASVLGESGLRKALLELFNQSLIDIHKSPCTYLFKQFSGLDRPSLANLPCQLRSQFLDLLIRNQGIVIIKQQLDEIALIGRAAENSAVRIADSLGQHELIALDELADRAQSDILVTTPGRLLQWNELRQILRMQVDKDTDGWRIALSLSSGKALSIQDLDGLAFTVPAHAPELKVTISDGVNLSLNRAPDPALQGHDCVYFPWEKRQWPSS